MNKLLTCIFFIASFSFLSGQDTTYIKSFPYKGRFEISPAALTQRLDLFKKGIKSDSAHAVYMPNLNSTLGFNLSWKFLSLGYSFKIPNASLNENTYGKTNYFNLSFSTYGRYVGGEVFYSKYDHFFQPRNKVTTQRRRGDVYFIHTGLNMFFFTNTKKFSYRAPFTQSRRQLKSAGGFVLMTEFALKKFAGDSSLLPSSIDDATHFAEYQRLKSITFGIFELKPAYAYNFVFKGGKYYMCPMLAAGAGISPYHYKTENANGNTIALHADFNFKLAMGYDVEHFFLNFTFQADKNTNFLRKNLVFDHTVLRADVTAGWRFDRKKKK